jgi:hypothetical protein
MEAGEGTDPTSFDGHLAKERQKHAIKEQLKSRKQEQAGKNKFMAKYQLQGYMAANSEVFKQ